MAITSLVSRRDAESYRTSSDYRKENYFCEPLLTRRAKQAAGSPCFARRVEWQQSRRWLAVPSPLAGEGGERRRREPGEGFRSATTNPSPALTRKGRG